MATKKTYKLDLFPLLRNISTKNVGYYDTLSEESLKEFSPLPLQRWLSGCNDGKATSARQIYFLNEVVNKFIFAPGFAKNHKKLIYNLMTLATTGKDCRYKYLKSNMKGTSDMPLAVGVIQKVFDYNRKDARDAIMVLSDNAIINMAEQLGYQTGEIKELKKELKKRPV